MSSGDLEFHSHEDSDWGYARTKRTVLMSRSAEWVQSVFSCRFESNGKPLVAPNRDYPYEGLMAHHEGEHWRFIDCVAVSVQSFDGRWATLVENDASPAVRVNPDQVTYLYRYSVPHPETGQEDVRLAVAYRLHSASPAGMPTGSIELSFLANDARPPPWAAVVVQPFLDLRHMFAGSDFGRYRVVPSYRGGQRVEVHCYNRRLTLFLPAGSFTPFPAPEILCWNFKLGTGQRQEVLQGPGGRTATRFVGERRSSAAFFELRPHFLPEAQRVRIYFCCEANPESSITVVDLERIHAESERLDARRLRVSRRLVSPRWGKRPAAAIVARILGAVKFQTRVHDLDSGKAFSIPHAGAWWFRTPWFRDVFEGLSSSFRCLMALEGGPSLVKDSVELALAYQDPTTGLVPNRIPEQAGQGLDYNSVDATLLCLLTACRYVEETGDPELARKTLDAARVTISALEKEPTTGTPRPEGPPRLDRQTGLVLCVPWHSWIDTRCQALEHGGHHMEWLPNRVSPRFVKDLWQHVDDKQHLGALLASPRFFLPEINAQWIGALTALLKVLDRSAGGVDDPEQARTAAQLREIFHELVARARRSFIEAFWNAETGFLFNVVYEDRQVKDAIDCEAAVTAAAMLGDSLFAPEQLSAIWRRAERTLLVRRRLIRFGNKECAFGLMVKNDDRRIYYGDLEYHSDVVWPRSTHYLVRLLRLLGHDSVVRELLLNALDHQMTEGAIFYSHELFSRPFGNNPSPDPRTCDNPVPVKNPIQFWSQWADVFLEFFGEGEPKP